MKTEILQISLGKIQEAFGRQRISSEDGSSKSTTQVISSVATNTELLSLEGILPTKSVSRVNQLRTEIAQGAAFFLAFETGNTATIPRGMSCSNHIGTDDDVEYIKLAKGDPKAPSSGITGGYSIRLPDQIEVAASGHHITVHVIARASGSNHSRFAVAYSTNEVGNSGWCWFNAGAEWSVYTMEYDVPVMKEGQGDFVGILPDNERGTGTDFCYLVIAITKNEVIQGIPHQKNSTRTIVVSSNCQTGGVAAALQEIFWKDKVLAVPHVNHADEQILEYLSNADIWVSSGKFELIQKSLTMNPKLVLHKIPSISFRAFHPDLVYANRISTSKLIFTSSDYQSAICVWAYKNGLEIADTVALFTSKVFYELGYFSMWKTSIDNLSQTFKSFNLDLGLFLPFIIRQGLFMYTSNHPKVYALIRLAKIIALRIGANESILEKDINISDGLASLTVWPIYPEIAEFYALGGGSYDWRISPKKKISGLKEYIEESFNSYQKQGIERHDIKYHSGGESVYDNVLGSIVRVKK